MCNSCSDRRHSLKDAVRSATVKAPALVVWSKRLGYIAVSLSEWDGSQGTADLLCLGLGKHPIPLNPTALEAWLSMIAERAHQLNL